MYFIIAWSDWVISYFGVKFSEDLFRHTAGESESLPDELSTTFFGSAYITEVKKSIS